MSYFISSVDHRPLPSVRHDAVLDGVDYFIVTCSPGGDDKLFDEVVKVCVDINRVSKRPRKVIQPNGEVWCFLQCASKMKYPDLQQIFKDADVAAIKRPVTIKPAM